MHCASSRSHTVGGVPTTGVAAHDIGSANGVGLPLHIPCNGLEMDRRVTRLDESAVALLGRLWRGGAYAFLYASGTLVDIFTVNASGELEQVQPPTIPPPFTLSPSTDVVPVAPGTPGSASITVVVNNPPFASKIELTASGLPSGATAKFNPASIAAPGNGTSTLTLRSTRATPVGFCSQPNCIDGQGPYAGLIQASDGNLYGTTRFGGAGPMGSGTIFQLSLGLAPPVQTLATSANPR